MGFFRNNFGSAVFDFDPPGKLGNSKAGSLEEKLISIYFDDVLRFWTNMTGFGILTQFFHGFFVSGSVVATKFLGKTLSSASRSP